EAGGEEGVEVVDDADFFEQGGEEGIDALPHQQNRGGEDGVFGEQAGGAEEGSVGGAGEQGDGEVGGDLVPAVLHRQKFGAGGRGELGAEHQNLHHHAGEKDE